jgi:hypothetical protein
MFAIASNHSLLITLHPKNVRSVHDTAQESEMNALGSYFYSMMWFIKPKKYNNQYYADNHLGECSKRQYCITG